MSDELLRDGRYQLIGTLGEGSQGTTFDAIDRLKGRPVAIKRFAVRGARSWKDVELAEREASVLESLSHPALPSHVEHFEEDGVLYLVMEKIDGSNLASLLTRGASLSREDVVQFLREASLVLDYLHGRSPPIIHRDVNPRNVIRRADGSFVLVDFGAVRDRLKPEGGSTVVGTFGYMAPEQFQGRALPQSDVYAAGATALRMLTGSEPDKLPHRGLGIDVAESLQGFPPAFRDAFEKMLDPDPDRRATRLSPLVARLERELGAPESGEAERPRRRDRQRSREDRASQRNGSNHHEPSSERDPAPWQRAREPGWHDTGWQQDPWAPWWMDEGRRARKEARRQVEEWRRTQNQYKQAKRERQRARRERQRQRRERRGRRPLNGPPLALLVLGITVALLVVRLVLGVFVPALLTLLSILFGPPLREAARNVRAAGQDARLALRNFQSFLLRGSEPRSHEDATHAEPTTPRVRVEPEPPPRRRVEQEEDVIDTTGTDVTERHERR